MGLVLRIRSTESKDAPREVTLPASGGTLGRDAGCTVVLHDPAKHLSRQHLRIQFQDGQYRLTVVSRVNPVDINGNPLRFGESAPLATGDTIGAPPYEIEIVGSSGGPAVSPPRPEDHAPTHAAFADSFPWADNPESQGDARDDDIFNLGILARPAAPKPSAPDPFRRAPGPRSQGPLGDFSGTSPDLIDNAGQRDTGTLDPLKALDSLDGAAPGDADPFGIRAAPLVDLGGQERRGTPSLDHVHDINLPFPNLTPLAPRSEPPRPPSPPKAEPRPAPPASRDPLDQLLEDLAKQTPAAPGHDASIPPFDFPIPTPRGGPPPSARVLEALLVEPPAPASRPPEPVPAAAQVAAAAAPGSAALDPALDHFLAGLGIPRDALHIASDEETLELAGRIVRAAIESIIAFLLSRSVVKKELRAADRTMLASRDNNPLKVMENTDEALRFLFDTSEERRRAFKAPVPALQDACDDILAHEVALLAGCRAAVIAAFRRFDPALIEKQNEKGGLLGAINRRAQLWDGYVAQFEKTQAELADQVERVLSRDFMKEYMIQVAKFKRDRPPRE